MNIFTYCLIISSFSISLLTAQTDFSLTTFHETYVPLNDTISLMEGQIWDDPNYTIPIGFEFQFFGFTYNTLYSRGSIGAFLSPSQVGGDIPLIIPYGSDLADRGYDTDVSESEIAYKLTGEIGSQILKIEWRNVGFYREIVEQDTSISYTNFQLWIHEGSNDLEVRFGQSHIPNFAYSHGDDGVLIAVSDSIGLFGSGPGHIYHLQGSEFNPVLNYLPSEELFDDYNLITAEPIFGRVYRLSSQITATVNPSNDLLKVKFYPSLGSANRTLEIDLQLVSRNLTYRVVSANGQTMMHQTVQAEQTLFDVQDWPKGMYYLSLIGETAVVFNTSFIVD